MAYKKKISDEQFVKDCIDFELKPYDKTFDDIMALPKLGTDEKPKDGVEYQDQWYTRYVFHNYDEFLAWKTFFFEHYKDWQPTRNWRRQEVENEFNWFNLQFGLKYDFEWETLKEEEKKAPDVFKKVFGKNK